MPQQKIKGIEPSSGLTPVFKWLSHLSGAIAFTWSLWCFILTAFLLGSNIFIVLNIDGYKPTTFVVENIYFLQTQHRGSSTTYGEHYAVGIVDGAKERFSLSGYIPSVINSREEIEKHVHVGQRLAVMYNPDVSKPKLRVLYPEKNFVQKWKNRQRQLINMAYVPYVVLMFFCFLFGIFGGVLKSCIGLFASSIAIIFFAWIPVLIGLFSSYF